jgi:hypothetical protein
MLTASSIAPGNSREERLNTICGAAVRLIVFIVSIFADGSS